jgi:hypothetical protein
MSMRAIRETMSIWLKCAATSAVLAVSWVATATVGVRQVQVSYGITLETATPGVDGTAPAWSPCPFVVVAEFREDGTWSVGPVPEVINARYYRGVFLWFFGLHRPIRVQLVGVS